MTGWRAYFSLLIADLLTIESVLDGAFANFTDKFFSTIIKHILQDIVKQNSTRFRNAWRNVGRRITKLSQDL